MTTTMITDYDDDDDDDDEDDDNDLPQIFPGEESSLCVNKL